jgi:L-ascorbate metabolism protein UlaG (beta-lactamase superfamily)
MIITYHGKQFFKIQQGETIVALNPISKDSKFKEKVARFGSALVLSTTNHPDYNGIETVTYGTEEPVAITGPGDYEVKDIFIKGLLTRVTLDKKEYMNTVYSMQLEGISVTVLGALSKPLEASEREGIESPDILFVPIGEGEGLLDTKAAYKLAVSLEPGIIIPTDYTDTTLKAFLKEAGADKVVPLDKLVLKKKDLLDKQAEVVVLSY